MEIRAGKRFRTKEERRQIVEETMQPGASVSRVARAYDINANVVFQWRRQYRAGWFDDAKPKSTALLPVRLQKLASAGMAKATAMHGGGTIDIDLGHARVRIEGAADPDCVRAALEGLAR